jgi:hypothetical protein
VTGEPCPELAEAVRRLRALLRERGWPTVEIRRIRTRQSRFARTTSAQRAATAAIS